ncbi:shikimate kinase [Jeotgalibacillus soli]|uniref:Shikimate kinase n=1 Tax=Jeotgalibacillus soli TaxID=889306 RepID=A0A0C2VK55_9BACL|nr:shikimate kinase [Jeotgalibacillus soli]KIL44383.1 shikimate kinase [Jeotgalibacillus soli]
MPLTSSIYLIGFMGAGKSTIAEKLAERFEVKYYDIDQHIEEKENKSISSIFQERGERYFRDKESSTLTSLMEPSIIATGGGILYFPETAEWLKKHGTVIYLHAPFEELYERIIHDQTRPVAASRSKGSLNELFNSRDLAYRDAAHIIVSVSERSVELTIEDILLSLEKIVDQDTSSMH